MAAPIPQAAEGLQLVTLSKSSVQTWEVDYRARLSSLREVTPVDNASFTCVRWNHNNQVIALAGADGSIFLLHSSGKVLQVLREPDGQPVRAIAWEGRSRYLCTCGTISQPSLWDLRAKQRVRSFRGHETTVTTVAFATDDVHVASGNEDGQVLIHGIHSEEPLKCLSANGQPAASSAQKSAVSALSYWPSRPSMLLVGHRDGTVRGWDLFGHAVTHLFSRQHTGRVTAVCGSPLNGKLLATSGTDGRLCLLDMGRKCLVKETQVDGGILDMVFHPNGGRILAGMTSGHVTLFDLREDGLAVHMALAHAPQPLMSLSIQHSRPTRNATAPRTPGSTASPAATRPPHHTLSTFNPQRSIPPHPSPSFLEQQTNPSSHTPPPPPAGRSHSPHGPLSADTPSSMPSIQDRLNQFKEIIAVDADAAKFTTQFQADRLQSERRAPTSCSAVAHKQVPTMSPAKPEEAQKEIAEHTGGLCHKRAQESRQLDSKFVEEKIGRVKDVLWRHEEREQGTVNADRQDSHRMAHNCAEIGSGKGRECTDDLEGRRCMLEGLNELTRDVRSLHLEVIRGQAECEGGLRRLYSKMQGLVEENRLLRNEIQELKYPI